MQLIVLSGAHGSGKTTLVHSLKQHFQKTRKEGTFKKNDVSKTLNPPFYTIPSFASQAFESLHGLDITEYNDINKKGLRSVFQCVAISKFLENFSILQTLIYKNNPIFISDRWIADCYAYTKVEMESDKFILDQLDVIQKRVIAQCKNWNLNTKYYILKYRTFEPNQNKPSRGTCDPLLIEKYILEWYHKYDFDYTVLQSDNIEKKTEIITKEV